MIVKAKNESVDIFCRVHNDYAFLRQSDLKYDKTEPILQSVQLM